jgi:type IV fimbrial biogenesis protein FimT
MPRIIRGGREKGLPNTTTAGFTLVEMMIVVVIIVVVAGIGIPNVRQFLDKARVSTHANDLVSDLNLARMESRNRGQQIAICGSVDGSTCTGDGSGWSTGRIIFIDADKNGARNNSEAVLFRGVAVDSAISITSSGFPNSDFVRFMSYGGMSPSGAGTFTVCPVNPTPGFLGRQVSVPLTGRVTLSAVPCP